MSPDYSVKLPTIPLISTKPVQSIKLAVTNPVKFVVTSWSRVVFSFHRDKTRKEGISNFLLYTQERE